MRYFSLFFIIFIFLACSKKSDQTSPQNPTFSNYDVIRYWGYDVGKTHKYYAIDTSRFIIPNLTDTTMVYQDTFLRVIKDTFGNLNVEYYDSFYTSQSKIYDTLYVVNPFVIDTIRTVNFLDSTSQVSMGYKVFKAPLSLNDNWIPIESQSKYIGDTLRLSAQQLGSCTLWIYLDSLKIDSSKKVVIEASPDTSFKLFSKVFSKIKYRYQTKPQTPFCNDTTIKKDTAFITSFDTTYLKAYLGIMNMYRFDSTIANLQVGMFPIQAVFKVYSRRVKVQ
ncbi:MAG: hypothetical protein ABIL49_07405 [candidate division WOR-3 bacterium]|jgi:hypothetical protein